MFGSRAKGSSRASWRGPAQWWRGVRTGIDSRTGDPTPTGRGLAKGFFAPSRTARGAFGRFSFRRIWLEQRRFDGKTRAAMLSWLKLPVPAVLLAACSGNPKAAASSGASRMPSAPPPAITYITTAIGHSLTFSTTFEPRVRSNCPQEELECISLAQEANSVGNERRARSAVCAVVVTLTDLTRFHPESGAAADRIRFETTRQTEHRGQTLRTERSMATALLLQFAGALRGHCPLPNAKVD